MLWADAVKATGTARVQVVKTTDMQGKAAAWKAYTATLAPLEAASNSLKTSLESDKDKMSTQEYEAGILSVDSTITYVQEEQKIASSIQTCFDNGDISKCRAEIAQTTKNFDAWSKAMQEVKAKLPTPSS